jgi:UDP-3-O-[3-hydroxymyristoyl] glucosamine N-acyltransferase
MAESRPEFAINDLIAQVSRMSKDRLKMRLLGENVTVSRFMPPNEAGEGDMSFLTNEAYAAAMKVSKASLIILREKDLAALFGDEKPAMSVLLCDNPYAFFAFASQLLFAERRPAGVDRLAFVEEGAEIDPTARIEAFAVVRRGAKVGARTVVKTGAVIGEGAKVGADCLLYPNVVLERGTQCGDRCIFQPGCVIGGDGFGFAPFYGEWVKIPQVGRVVIGDDVEIGANTTVDRGALDDTVIGEGTKLDNLIQLGHNDRIGRHVVMAACVGIAGSTEVGDHTMIGGAANINGHIRIPAGSGVGPATSITGWGELPAQKIGFFPAIEAGEFQRTAAMVSRLPQLRRELKALEKRVEELSGIIRSADSAADENERK